MREQILKKERNLMINSTIIEEYPWLKKQLLANEKVSIDQIDDEHKNSFRYVVPYILKQCGEEWKGDESVLNPIEDLGNKRRPCALCGTPNKYIYYIENRLNGNKLNVGRDCVEEFVDIKSISEGISRNKLIKRAQEIRRMNDMNDRFPGIQNKMDAWLVTVEKYPIVIPNSIKDPYNQKVKTITGIYNDYLKGLKDEIVFSQIEEFIQSEYLFIKQFEDYIDRNSDNPLIATRKMIRWLEDRKDSEIIELLNETGKITRVSVPRVWEKEYFDKQHKQITVLFNTLGLNVLKFDDNDNHIVFAVGTNKINLILPYEKFLSYFGPLLIGEHPFVPFIIQNVITVSKEEDFMSIYHFIDQFRRLTKKWGIGLRETDNSIDQNIVYLKEKESKLYVQVKVQDLFKYAKGIVFGMNKPTKHNLENFITQTPGKRYTKEDIRELNNIVRNMDRKPL
jgi:mRNA-degrading endonuclease HigB of HigAB toxin-antitoxin module